VQARWDGERWTARRRWNGGMWVEEAGLRGGTLPGALTGGPTGPAGKASHRGASRAPRKSRRRIVIVALVLVVAAGAVAYVVTSSKSSPSGTSSAPTTAPPGAPTTTAGSSATSAPTTTPLPESPPAAEVAACQGDAQSVAAAVTAYQARNGSAPAPPSPWSAGTYVSNFALLTSSASGGPYLRTAPGTSHYVIEYDGAGHVWVAPPGVYSPTFSPGQAYDGNPAICLPAVH